MLMYRRYFWITRLAPLALVGVGIIALLPSDFKAAANSISMVAPTVQPAMARASMPAPKLLSTAAITVAPTPVVAISQPPTLAPSSVEANTDAAAEVSPSAPDAGLAEQRDAQIGGSGVNVRAGASKDFAVLFTLAPGAAIKTRETLNGWVHIYADSGDGWIFSSYVAGNEPKVTAAAVAQSSANSGLVGRAMRLRSAAQVYDSPGGDRIYVLDAGERVRVAEANSNWVRIVTDSDESGWVRLR